MIKAVIFDVGGVLVRTIDQGSRRTWERKLGLAERESEEIVFNSKMGTKAQMGAITEDTLWQWVGERLSLRPADLAEFRQAFWAGDVLDTELVDYIRKLRPFYQTAIISNFTDGLRHTLHTTYPAADAFDLITVSAEEKVMKPEPEIYQRTLQRLERRAAESVFVDDFAHNVAAARELGMSAIHYRPGLNVPIALAELGVQPTPHKH